MTISTRPGLIKFTVPAGTPIAAPATVPVSFGDIFLRHINVRVPPGHNGATGLQIVSNGSFVVPWSASGDWLIASDEQLDFPWNDEIDTAVVVNGYNTGIYDHTFYMRFFYTPMTLLVGQPSGVSIQPVS